MDLKWFSPKATTFGLTRQTYSSSATALKTALQKKRNKLYVNLCSQAAIVLHPPCCSYLIISFALAVAKFGCATKRWRKSVFKDCRGEKIQKVTLLQLQMG